MNIGFDVSAILQLLVLADIAIFSIYTILLFNRVINGYLIWEDFTLKIMTLFIFLVAITIPIYTSTLFIQMGEINNSLLTNDKEKTDEKVESKSSIDNQLIKKRQDL
ncbi:hypothetical protein CI266_004637 [Salmonella enterica subsp. enterica serovar Kotte]|nr:hypothetical protein [Salmonella enterica subsp. enterica serovar Kotte]